MADLKPRELGFLNYKEGWYEWDGRGKHEEEAFAGHTLGCIRLMQKKINGAIQVSRFQHFDRLWSLFSQGTDQFEEAWYHVVVAYAWNLPMSSSWKLLAPFLPLSWHPSGRISCARSWMSTVPNTIAVLQSPSAKFPVCPLFHICYRFRLTGNQFLWISFLPNLPFNVILIHRVLIFSICMITGRLLRALLNSTNLVISSLHIAFRSVRIFLCLKKKSPHGISRDGALPLKDVISRCLLSGAISRKVQSAFKKPVGLLQWRLVCNNVSMLSKFVALKLPLPLMGDLLVALLFLCPPVFRS